MVGTLQSPSRDRLLAAAAKEFAARGYDGTSVDRIARAARLNKAMIYYHFKNKAGLYRAIVRDAFEAARDAAERVLHTDQPAEEKLRAFVRTIAEMASSRPHFPPLWLREFSLGARHMDPGTLKVAGGVVAVLAQILREGVEARRFRQVNPLAVHIGIVAPIMLFLVSDAARLRLQRAEIRGAADLSFDQIVAHVTESTVGSLQRDESAPSGE
jgi:AcrR family transcriptional regulator